MYISALKSYNCLNKTAFEKSNTAINNRQTQNGKASQKITPDYRYYTGIISFGQNKKDPLSFNEFTKAAKGSGITSLDALQMNIKPENMIGTGANSTVYSFDNPKLNNWVLKEDKKPFWNPCKSLFEETKDEFPNHNMGQEIARAGDRYRILKRINGDVHSIKDWSYHINNNSIVSREEAISFNKQLGAIADFPQETFDDYAQQLRTLSQHGYKQDSINPNNILIDYDKKIIHIIDYFKADQPVHINSRLDLINVLLDFSLFNNFYGQLDEQEQAQLLKSSNEIAKKCSIASQKAGIIQDEKTYIDFLTEVDKWFGCHLVDKGGDYRTRYSRMKELLPDIA